MPEAGCSFRQVDEKHVSPEVDFMSWSPKMDLIAIANVQGEVNLHRLSWQKVWNGGPPGEGDRVTALAWRPDGKVLAVGYSSGELILCDIEDSNTIHSTKLFSRVSCMSWIDKSSTKESADAGKVGHSAGVLQDECFLPKLPAFNKSYTAMNKGQSEENYEDLKKVKSQKELNLLLVGTENSHIHLFAYGIFSVGMVDLNAHGVNKSGSVLSAYWSHDLQLLSLLVENVQNDGETKETSLLSYDTTLLASRHTEIKSLAMKFGQILSLTSYLSSTIQQMTEAWEDILLEMDSKLMKFAEDKRKVCGGSVSNDFLHLLMFGMPSDELEQFLLHDLTEKGLKKLGHSIETSYSNIQKLVLKHLQSVGQALVYHLFDVRAMALWYGKYGVLGLSAETVQHAINMAESFMLKASELQQVIDGSMKNFKAFFRWLYVVIQKLSGEPIPPELSKMTQQDLNFVAQFLSENFTELPGEDGKSGFKLEKVGQYLKDEALTDIPGNTSNPWVQFLENNPKLKASPLLYSSMPDKSLIQMYDLVTSGFQDILQKCASVIGQSFQCVTTQQLFTQPRKNQDTYICRMSQMSKESEAGSHYIYTAYTTEHIPCQTCFILRQHSMDHSLPIEVVSFSVGRLGVGADDSTSSLKCDNHKLLDLAFYDSDTVTLLLEEVDEDCVPVLAQLQLSVLEEHFIPVHSGDGSILSKADIPCIDVGPHIDDLNQRRLENMKASQFAVSGTRNVACVLFSSKRRVRLFMMDAEDEDDDDNDDEIDDSTLQDGDTSQETSREMSQDVSHDVMDDDIVDDDEDKENSREHSHFSN